MAERLRGANRLGHALEDVNFPWLEVTADYPFPDPSVAEPNGLLAVGGNYSPGMMLSAYRRGCFPWSGPDEPIFWYNLDPRFVLYPDELHVSESLKKFLKSHPFRVTLDQDFPAVMRACGETKRPRQRGTWVTEEILRGYTEIHQAGYGHSVEVWLEDTLVGGLFGMRLGGVFYGESMFARVDNASKVAFALLVPWLKTQGIQLIDCQAHTKYLESFGARLIPRTEFLRHLRDWVSFPEPKGSWKGQVLAP